MLQKPEKPKHYLRDHCIIVILAFVIMAGLLFLQSKPFYVGFAPLWFFILASGFWFRKYHAETARYQKVANTAAAQTYSSPQSSTTNCVNENIARYERLQTERRARAKWWQFWV